MLDTYDFVELFSTTLKQKLNGEKIDVGQIICFNCFVQLLNNS